MVTKTINININDSELDELNKDLLSTKRNIDNIESSAERADGGLKKVGDNGGAISTLDSFTGGLATRIRDAAEASKLFSINLKGVQAAIVATGIGAFVVALGLIVAYWGEIKGLVTGVNVELEDQIALQKEISDEAEFQLKVFEAGENVLRLQGKTEQEIIELKKQRIQQVLETTKAELEYQKQQLEGQLEAEKNAKGIFAAITNAGSQTVLFISKALDGLLARLGIDIGLEEKAASIRGSIFDNLFGNKEGIEERKKEIEELTLAVIQQQDKLAAIELERRESIKSPDGGAVQVLPLTGLAGLDALDETLTAEFDALLLAETARTNLEEEQSRYRRQIAQAEAEQKAQAYLYAAEAFSSASTLIGQETAAGKALAVASALISTYLSAQQAYLAAFNPVPTVASPFLGAAFAGVAVLSGLANVKKILSVKVPGQGGGGGIAGGSPSTPPAFNVVQNNPQNQLNQSLLEQNNEPVEAFVVDKNVTSAQEARRNKIESSSI